VKGIDLDIRDGEMIVLVGPSGCGKSTLLRMVAGLETITSGTLRIGERVVNDLEPADRDIAMVFQNYALYPHMTVYDNLAYGLKNRRYQARRDRTAGARGGRDAGDRGVSRPQAAPAFGRAAPAGGDGPGAGARACGLPVRRAAVEPRRQAAGADARRDPAAAEAAGTTSLYVTHDQLEALTLADRLVVLNGGRDRAGRHADGGLRSARPRPSWRASSARRR
jgi:ABC-type sugar transport system ATPase subunit